MAPAIMIPEGFGIVKTMVTNRNNFFDKRGFCAYYIDKIHTQKYPGNPDTSATCSNLSAIRDIKKDKLNIIGYVIKSSATMLFKVMSEIKPE